MHAGERGPGSKTRAAGGVKDDALTSGTTRWNADPLYPKPFCPVASSLKLRAVFGHRESYSRRRMRPQGFPSISTSNWGRTDEGQCS